MAPGVVIQGDAIEDVYAEVDLTIEVLDQLHGDPLTTLQLTLPPNQRVTNELIASMNASAPKTAVLFILRKREVKYRVVNGYGLWAKTIRGDVDAPLEAKADLAFVAAELAGKTSVEQLAQSLR